MSERINESRLPPPAFPPGSRKHPPRNANGRLSSGEVVGVVDEPLAAGQEPSSDGIDALRAALISPDEPLPERREGVVDAFEDAQATAAGAGEAVGMDLDPHLQPERSVSGGDPHVIELMRAVAKLAHAVRNHGEAGLRVTPDMSRFEFTLRAYCAGYLAGRRAEEPPRPKIEEALPTDG